MLDTLGCAYGGIDSRPADIVREVVASLGGRQEASIIGSPEKTTAPLATWANGTMIRYLNANDYYFGRDGSHASGNLAAVLAMCERQKLGGRDLILGLVAAYEVQLRFCDSAGQPRIWDRGWHNCTNMQFSSAAASARLIGLDEAAIANAIAIAGSQNNTIAQLQRGNIPMMKATAEATVAKGGVEAALLAAAGLTGPEEVLEGKVGWAQTVAGAVDFAMLTAPVEDGAYRILKTCTKPYAAEFMTLAAIQAAVELREEFGLTPEAIRAVEARFHEYAFKKPSWDPKKLVPTTRETADHSFPYMIAVTLLEGDCSEHQFREELLRSDAVREMMGKIMLATDAELTALWPRASGAAIRIETASGETLERIVRFPPGHPENPESDASLERKFRRSAERTLPPARIEEIIEAIWVLDRFDDIDGFTRLLR